MKYTGFTTSLITPFFSVVAMFHKLALFFICLFSLTSCSTNPYAIPGPAHTVKRSEVISIAYTYTQLRWAPGEQHKLHGPDKDGILVHTPDKTLSSYGYANGWWKTGQEMTGMPYQWGGFDTPHQFLDSLKRDEVAGDISTPSKRELGDAGTSSYACGIDCSGFVSRCWRLKRPYSTKQLPEICLPLKTWPQLRPGDILLNDRHVLLFKDWDDDGRSILAYEAGPYPVWRVNAHSIPVSKLEREGYSPWRYKNIRD